MPKHVGILTSGGDCPGLNAALRGFGRAAIQRFGMEVLGFLDGFPGFVIAMGSAFYIFARYVKLWETGKPK